MLCRYTLTKFRAKCLLLILVVILTAIPNNAHTDDDAMVTLKVTPDTVRVGDMITLDIFIKHKEGFSLYLPDSIDLGSFDIIDTKIADLKKEGGIFSQATFKMAIFKVGVFSIPTINLLLKSGDKRVEILTQERQLEVASVLKTSGNALLDIYPPLDIRQSYLKYLIYVWSISFLLIVGAIVHFMKRRNEQIPATTVRQKPKDDPKKLALELIGRLFDTNSLSELNDKELCESVSFTVKNFIKEKFDIDSLEMTSRELIDCIYDIGIGEDYTKTLYGFLSACDLVKFAKRPLVRDDSRDDLEHLKNSALSIVQI